MEETPWNKKKKKKKEPWDFEKKKKQKKNLLQGQMNQIPHSLIL